MMQVNNLFPNGGDVDAYRAWLRRLVVMLAAPTNFNEELFNIAWEIKYVPTIPNDKNRRQDGIDLRALFVNDTSNGLPELGECSILEFLVALSMKLNEQDYDYSMPDRVGPWFWTLMDNLGIIEADPPWIRQAFEKIDTRDYATDGWGGLFPLVNAHKDQRKVEVWYQMQAYLMENLR